ncbi:hypothetical protein MKQ68_22470 [Chitinophaga horti]|uniref:Sigma-70 family RNA polymerase sigma factor n=1 Tax=Chitinophaga horti TaxID=2920382 RepID=A0ABY6J3H1_9BACT|nr:hypothetical protein [Chitinophaga horti]UYQ92849.1 hypothetical protein MKQ68_22470 [Chitinophaga horti]
MEWKELEGETIENLIEFLQLEGNSEDEEWAEAAFVNVVFRFREDLLEKCTEMCLKSNYTETDAEEITNRVFERVKMYPTFKSAGCKVKDIIKCFKFYLYRIARNEFADYRTPDDNPYTGDEQIITSLIDPCREYEPETLKSLQEKEKLLDNIFSKLTPKHKTIYLTYLYYEHEGRYLPRKLVKDLSEVLKLAKGSIRAYKKEAFELVKSMGYGK